MSAQRIELTIRRQGHPDMAVPLPSGSIHIGRAEDNGLVLPDIAVSRRHARLTVSATGVTIEDVGSGNGTYFDGKPLRKRELLNGDEVLIDPFVLVFSIPVSAEPEATDSADAAARVGPPRVVGVAKLVLVHGTGLRPEYTLREGGLSMGRAEQRDIVLPDPAASRSHAEIVKQGDGWLLKDFGSVNGTFVNSKRVRDHLLVDGDRVRIGATELRYEAPKLASKAPEAAPPPVSPSPGTKPFENLIFGVEGGAGALPPGFGSDKTFVPKGLQKEQIEAQTVAGKYPTPPAPSAAPPSLPEPPRVAAPQPKPSRPADDAHFATASIPPPPPAAQAPPRPPAPPPTARVAVPPPQPSSPPVAAAPPPQSFVPPAAAPPPQSFVPPAAAPPPQPFAPPAAAPPPQPFAPPAPAAAPPQFATPVAAPPVGAAPHPFAAPAPLAPPPGVAPTPMGAPGAVPAGPQPGFAPLAPPPGAAAAPASPGFGSVEMDMGGGKRKKGRKMKLSGGSASGGGARPQGTFVQRNIGKITAGFAVLALLLFSIGYVKNNMSDTPSVKRVASASTGSAEATVASPESAANQSAIDSLIGQGNALFAEKKYLEAVEKYAAVQKLSPNNATATKMGYHACEFMVVQAMYATLSKRTSTMAEQQEAYDAAMGKANDAISNRGNLGEAITAVQDVQEYFPDDQPLQDILSKLESRRRGAVVRSRQRKADEHVASIGDLFAAAQGARNFGDSMAAIQGYERVLAADPDKQTELYWKAEEEIRQIKAELSARGREAYRSGLSAMKSGDYLTARAQFRETLRLDPFNQVAQRRQDEVQAKLDQLAQKFWSEAEIYEKTNQLEMAIGRYRKVMEYCASASSPLSQKAKKRIDALMQ